MCHYSGYRKTLAESTDDRAPDGFLVAGNCRCLRILLPGNGQRRGEAGTSGSTRHEHSGGFDGSSIGHLLHGRGFALGKRKGEFYDFLYLIYLIMFNNFAERSPGQCGVLFGIVVDLYQGAVGSNAWRDSLSQTSRIGGWL